MLIIKNKCNMKKILILALSVAAFFSAASCQKADVVKGEGNVTIKVGMPATKAISDGLTAEDLQYEVYYKGTDGKLTQILKSYTTLENKSATLDFTLMRGSSYVVLFWAQSPKRLYGTESLQAVQMNYTQVPEGNNEDRDAFFGKCEFTVSDDDDANGQLSCTLIRPFSQLNFVANDYDDELTVGGNKVATMTLTKTEITIKNLAMTFNVLTGTAAETATDPGTFPVTFTDDEGVDYDNDDNMDNFDGNTALRWVSMNYILVPDKQNTIDLEAKFTVDLAYEGITDPITNQPVTVYTNTSVPVAPNYRTNITGELFTEDGEVSIAINSGYVSIDQETGTVTPNPDYTVDPDKK